MPRKRKLLNVKSVLERVVFIRDSLDKFDGIPPVLHSELVQLGLLSRAILNKHKHTRKDVRLESDSV